MFVQAMAAPGRSRSGARKSLIDYRYKQHFKAKTGMHGMGRHKTGAKGADIVLKVPAGTQIFEEDDETLIDLMHRHPTLLERPIGVGDDRAVVGRPPENLLQLRGLRFP